MSQNLPYQQIPVVPSHYAAATVVARFIDGLGYRYYWATEKLTEQDLAYRPSEKGMSMLDTVKHIYDLSATFLNVVQQIPNIRPYQTPEMSFEEYRAQSLHNFEKASELFKQMDEAGLAGCKVVFQRGEKQFEFDHWFFINGQLADAMYHTGQLVTFRRTTGNPMNSKVNVFMGKTAE